MIRVRDAGYPASRKMRRAIRWCSASTSIVVNTPSARMPARSQRPLTPVPVPISTTARAPPDRDQADLVRQGPGDLEGPVLGDVVLGEVPGLRGRGRRGGNGAPPGGDAFG